MTKTIFTLVEDIENVVLGKGGWEKVIGDAMAQNISDMAYSRFGKPQEPRNYLSLSSIGTPCKRKLWYRINKPEAAEPPQASALLKFFFGDLIEELVLSLAVAAGHEVTGNQTRMDVHGIKGHRDAVIDGVTIDVKSASPASFKKFQSGELCQNDPFGYISQLSSYVYAGKDDPLVRDKTCGAFLVVNKVTGKLCLDFYDFSNQLEDKQSEMERAKKLVAGPIPDREYSDEPQSKTSPNRKLCMSCSYCEYKKECWPDIRTFLYQTGPEFLTYVEKEPRVPEA